MAAVCPDDIEADLCDWEEASAAHGVAAWPSFNAGQQLVLMSALALRSDSAATAFFVITFFNLLPGAKAAAVYDWTCKTIKNLYKGADCCGRDAQNNSIPFEHQEKYCPYNFTLPLCNISGPQAPRDLTRPSLSYTSTSHNAQQTQINNGDFHDGKLYPKAPLLTREQMKNLSLVNMHYHLGAEHKADEYQIDYLINLWKSDSNETRPGYVCEQPNPPATPYEFQHCKGVKEGYTYEVHFVHSSAGYSPDQIDHADNLDLDDGLGGAAHGYGALNPTIGVEAQVFHITRSAPRDIDGKDLVRGFLDKDSIPEERKEVWAYLGSTTGSSLNNTICSPYEVSWHVDIMCHKIKPEDFDEMCKEMKNKYGLDDDLSPHGSRPLVDPNWVVGSLFVQNETQPFEWVSYR